MIEKKTNGENDILQKPAVRVAALYGSGEKPRTKIAREEYFS